MSNSPNTTSGSVSSPAETPAKPRSPVMLIVLLLIMFALGGVLIVDNYVYYPACEEAFSRLEEAAAEHSRKSLADTGNEHAFFTKEDVRRTIGFGPTSQEVVDGRYLKEYYRWWGSLPLNRRYITVVYADKDGKQFKAHQIENEVEAANLAPDTPVPDKTTEDDEQPMEPSDKKPATDQETDKAAPSSKESDAKEPSPLDEGSTDGKLGETEEK